MKLCCLGLILLCVGCGAKVVKQFEVGNFQSVEVINSGDWTKSNIMKITTDKTVVMTNARAFIANPGDPCTIERYDDGSVWMFIGDTGSVQIKEAGP